MTRLAPLMAALLLSATAAVARPGDDAATPVAAPDPVPAARPLQAVLADLDAILLAGEALPPGERLLAVAYARRAGLLTGPGLPLAGLLAQKPGARP